MIKPDVYMNIGKIINVIEEKGFTISNIKMVKFSEQEAQLFYAEQKGKPFFNELIQFISSDLVVGLELVSEDCVNKWKNLLGPTDSLSAKK
jgi:nucleoside-diphosphate kinase